MSLTQQEENYIDGRIEEIYALVTQGESKNQEQVREYIDVGEYGLALDLLAHIQIQTGTAPSQKVVILFDELASKMEMNDAAEWPDVARVRKL